VKVIVSGWHCGVRWVTDESEMKSSNEWRLSL
jgi:hypothetical protein